MKAYLIDFENVNSKGLTGIEKLGADDKVIIFYSENSDTLSFEMHRKVMSSTADIEYLKVRVGGKNALDFQLSSLLGYLLAKELYTHIFIISGDKGFDRLHDFWNVSFADKNTCTVFRTQTIDSAVEFAAKNKTGTAKVAVKPVSKEPEEEPLPEIVLPDYIEDTLDKLPEDQTGLPAEEVQPEEAPSDHNFDEQGDLIMVEFKDLPSPDEPEGASPADEVNIVKAAEEKPKKKKADPEKQIRNALLGKIDLTDEEVASVLGCISGSEDKEDFHNALAKIFKGQATELYKVLRSKYLSIKLLMGQQEDVPAPLAGETPAPVKEPVTVTVVQKKAAEEKPAEKKTAEKKQAEKKSAEKKPAEKKAKKTKSKAKVSLLEAELEKRLAGECTAEEITAVARLFEETDTKQKLYLSIVKIYKKDRGCEIYKLIKSDYAALSKLKAEQGA